MLGGLGIVVVVVGVLSAGRSLAWSPAGQMYRSSITVHLPDGMMATGLGLCWAGVRNGSCLAGMVVYDGGDVTVELMSPTGGESPFSVSAAFEVS